MDKAFYYSYSDYITKMIGDLNLLLTVFTVFTILYYGTHRAVMNENKYFIPNLQ